MIILVCRQIIISVRSVCVSVCLWFCVSVCSDYNFGTAIARIFIFSIQIHLDHISGSSLSIKVIVSWSSLNEKNNIFYLTFTSVCLYSIHTYLKGQGHLKVKVTQYHGYMKGNDFLVNCKCFCKSCVSQCISKCQNCTLTV